MVLKHIERCSTLLIQNKCNLKFIFLVDRQKSKYLSVAPPQPCPSNIPPVATIGTSRKKEVQRSMEMF